MNKLEELRNRGTLNTYKCIVPTKTLTEGRIYQGISDSIIKGFYGEREYPTIEVINDKNEIGVYSPKRFKQLKVTQLKGRQASNSRRHKSKS